MRTWVAQLFQGADAKADEMSLIAVLIGLSFFFCTVALISLEVYSVLERGQEFHPDDFATAAATIYGAAGGVIAAMALGMGLKQKFGG
jgi:hypothetical protein